MMKNAKYALLAVIALAGTAAMSASASAMPAGGLATASKQISDVQDVRWVCGPYRCWWRPNVYPYYGAYGYYPVRPYRWWGPRWRRWHRW